MATVAAYIVLNPVRAALCADPKEYRYCGYAEALAKGSAVACEKIRTILGLPETTSWEELLTEYRKHLFMRGALASTGRPLNWPRLKRSLNRRKANSRSRNGCAARFAILATASSWEVAPLWNRIASGSRKSSATSARVARRP